MGTLQAVSLADVRRRVLGLASSGTVHMLLGALILLATRPWGAAAPPVPRLKVLVVERTPEDAKYPGLNPLPAAASPDIPGPIGNGDTGEPLNIHASRIAARADVLFPFLSPGVALDLFPLTETPGAAEALGRFRLQLDARGAAGIVAPPLALSDAEIQALADQSWSRRDRWKAFQPVATLARGHNGDKGALPALFRQYEQQNALQLYTGGASSDARLWAELDVASDHVDFIGFIRQFAAAHPRTKATTELLFLMDDLIQSSGRILHTLLETNTDTGLALTRAADPVAAQLIVGLKGHYHAALSKRLRDGEATDDYFNRVRLTVLEGIVRASPAGYRVNDARFLIGQIYWESRHFQEAVSWWRQIKRQPDLDGDHGPNPRSSDCYADAYTGILNALAAHDFANEPDVLKPGGPLAVEVNRLLVNSNGQWADAARQRLETFGYLSSTF